MWRELTGGVDDGFTHDVIAGQVTKSEEVTNIVSATINSLGTFPMFGGVKVVHLKNANFFGDDRVGGSEETKEAQQALLKTLKSGLPDSVRFIISTEKIDQRREFFLFLKDNAQIQIFNKIDISKDNWEAEVSRLVLGHAEKKGLKFTDEALELFIMLCSESTEQIVNELEKLDLYIGERREIDIHDVRRMTPLSRLGVVFEVGNALRDGNAIAALKLLDQQLEMEENPVKIMRASIINPIRSMFHVKILLDRCNPSLQRYDSFLADIMRLPEAERTWLPKKKNSSEPSIYPLFLSARQAKRYSLQQLEEMLHATALADKKLVTVALDSRLILHHLITELAAIMHQKPRQKS